tara:strand:- start:500 stop:889 length:390 start_codon:yes stop_codon:yes gene_type:complete
MADSFILKGVKDVVKNTGTAVRLNPPRGGDTFKFPKWWAKKQVQQYVESTIFKMFTDGGQEFRLVVPSSSNTELKVVHDGNGNFTFPQWRGVDRVAICDTDNSLLVEYQFPSIVKGPILKRTVQTFPTP